MRISDWSSDVCSSDLEAWRTGRTPRTISGEPAEVAPTGPAMSPRPRAAQGPEAGERNAPMLQCASGKLTEAGRPKPATIGVDWPQLGRAPCREACGSTFNSRWYHIHYNKKQYN